MARWHHLGKPDRFIRCCRLDHTAPPAEVTSQFQIVNASGAFDVRRPSHVSVSCLPHTGPDCFGRDANLELADLARPLGESEEPEAHA